MNKTSLLELAKKLNIPRRNCMKTKEELEEAIKDNITKYKDIILGPDTPVCMTRQDEHQKQQVINKKCMIKRSSMIREGNSLGTRFKNIS